MFIPYLFTYSSLFSSFFTSFFFFLPLFVTTVIMNSFLMCSSLFSLTSLYSYPSPFPSFPCSLHSASSPSPSSLLHSCNHEFIPYVFISLFTRLFSSFFTPLNFFSSSFFSPFLAFSFFDLSFTGSWNKPRNDNSTGV